MKRMKLEKKNILKAVVSIIITLAFVMPGAAAFANIETVGVTTNLDNTGTINIVEDGEGIDKREVTSDTSDVVEDAVLGSGGDIIYVGSGPGNDSATIHGGIALANPGDTVYVYNGTYSENVVVNKQVNLVGESKEGVIVDADGVADPIKVTANYVNITTLSAHNGGYTGSSIRLGASYATIANCNLYGSYSGIDLRWDLINNTITDCDIYDNRGSGINIQSGSNNIITGCDIHNNNRGVAIQSASNNLVYLNIFRDNEYQNAFDDWPNNMWDNGTVGNYWDDYHGEDADGDGIGDKPYYIPGDGGGRDRYPLMNPTDMTPPKTTCYLTGDLGEDDWYISPVTVTLEAIDYLSGVNYTMYKLDESEYEEYDGPITVSEDGEYELWYYSVDYVGNEETEKSVDAKIDQTDPTIDLTVEKTGLMKWLLTATVSDETSDVARVEFYLDGELLGTVTEPPYEWECTKKGTAHAIVYDNAGNEAISDEVPVSYSQSQIQSSSNLVPVQRRISWNSLTVIQNAQRRV